MKTLLAFVLLAAPASARVIEPSTLKACVKWSREIPDIKAAGSGRFSSVERVDGAGPYAGCDVVTQTETFGVGWLMRAWMKQGVFTACGERLGGYRVNYKGEEWQAKVVVGLSSFLSKNPEALAKIRTCVPPVVQTPAPVIAPAVIVAPLTPAPATPAPVASPAAAPETSTAPSPGAPVKTDSISQPAVAPVHTATELTPK